ncbi:MAG: TonB-dependent receptor [Cytophagia bacterium]|nr:MAG: TonB-dependent receptor [Cytophagales bacterium]TAG35363.1 MAG: TonB-dependent receptor [Cytophagia bacterium]TAG77267.1 MAG: TonB-dependent receptor [Cytophagales bacterium]
MKTILRVLFLWVILATMPNLLWGQASSRLVKLSGQVRDSISDKPIENAFVRINFGEGGTYTDTAGRFMIQLNASTFVVTIGKTGYRPFRDRLTLNDNAQISVRLIEVAKELEEVVISTQTVDANITRPLLGVTQMSIKTIKKLPAVMGEVDVLRSLQMMPGVTSVGEASNGVNIRGGTVDQNLILLDDAPIFNPTHLFGLFSVFPADALSSMELYKGTTPARYGGRAAAVLDISMTNPSLDKAKFQGGIGFVSNKFTADIPLVKDKMGILFTARGAFNDFLFQLGPERVRNIRANFGDVALKYFYRINPTNTLTASGYFNKDFFQTDLLGGINNINSVSTQYDYRTLNGTIKWFKTFNSKFDIQTVLVASNYTPRILLPEIDSDNTAVIRSSIRQRQLKSTFNYLPNASHKIEGGLSMTHYRLEPGELQPGTNTRTNPLNLPTENGVELAAHLEDEWRVSSALTVSLGLRYSYFMALGPWNIQQYDPNSIPSEATVTGSTTYTARQIVENYGGLEPRIGLRWAFSEQASIKAGYNLMRQYLQVISNTTTPLPTARWSMSNPYVRPQVSQLWSLGYFQNSRSNIYEFSVEGYYRSTTNVLDYRPGANFLLEPFIETQVLNGQSQAYGAELMVTKKRGELTGWANYTYSRVFNQTNQGSRFDEQVNNGNPYPANFDRPHNINLSLSFSESKYHSYSLIFTYSSGRPYTIPQGFVRFQNRTVPFYNERNQARIKDYHRLDFAWHIVGPNRKKRKWENSWTFTVYNLYGRNNQYSVFIKANAASFETFELTVFTTPIASLSYQFNF